MSADTVTIFIDIADVGDFPDNPDVGKIYEIGINGDGYMLAEDPDRGIVAQRGQVPLFPDRLATTATPFSESINRYTFFGISEFEGGEGEDFLSRPEADPKKYRTGSAIDPFEDGELTLGPGAVSERDTAYASARLAVVDDVLYVQSASDALDYKQEGGAWSTLASITDTTGAVTISGLTSDGSQWYAATGRSIIRGTTSNPGADWSAVDAVDVAWAAGRVMAAVKGGSSSTPNVLMPISDAGADESVGGLIVFPEGQTVVLGGVAQGGFFFGVRAGTESAIYVWQLGLDEAGNFFTPVQVMPLPDGSELVSVDAKAGSVFFTVVEADNTLVLYRGVPAQGGLQAVRTAELESAGSQTPGRFAEFQHEALCAWGGQLGALSLRTGGFARWSEDVGQSLKDVAVWDGTVVAVDVTGEVWRFDDGYATSGYMTTPIMDGASSLDKIWDTVTVMCAPLGANQSIEVQYSVDGGESWNTFGTLSSPGAVRREFDLGLQAPAISLRANLAGPGTTTPALVSLTAQVHPVGVTDRMIVVPIRCADTVRGLEGQIIDESGWGSGAVQARRLESYAGQRVRFQDLDWPIIGVTEIYEVMQVETAPEWVQVKGRPQYTAVVTLTMRRAVETAQVTGGPVVLTGPGFGSGFDEGFE